MLAKDERGAVQLRLSDADDGMSFAVALGTTIVVTLASNPSTGFRWEIVSPLPAALVETVTPEYIPPGAMSVVVGSAGAERFRMQAVSTGTAVLQLVYHRSLEKNLAQFRTFSVTLIVQ
jgi:inhibitor of cysteine peptidase